VSQRLCSGFADFKNMAHHGSAVNFTADSRFWQINGVGEKIVRIGGCFVYPYSPPSNF